jgi:hypothetical protein
MVSLLKFDRGSKAATGAIGRAGATRLGFNVFSDDAKSLRAARLSIQAVCRSESLNLPQHCQKKLGCLGKKKQVKICRKKKSFLKHLI